LSAALVGVFSVTRLVGEEGLTVHEDGAGVREACAEPVQDREAVGVHVAPVGQVEGCEPVKVR
jgi:hypothetical protein